MPANVRLNDLCTGHGIFPSRRVIQGSNNVFINGLPAVRVNDEWEEHCGGLCHNGFSETGSKTVFINGLPAFRIGDKIDCGSRGMTGSDDVFTGDYPQQPEF